MQIRKIKGRHYFWGIRKTEEQVQCLREHGCEFDLQRNSWWSIDKSTADAVLLLVASLEPSSAPQESMEDWVMRQMFKRPSRPERATDREYHQSLLDDDEFTAAEEFTVETNCDR